MDLVDRILEVVKAAKDNNCSIRIGVNAGSLDKSILEKYMTLPEALVESAKKNIKLLEDNDFLILKLRKVFRYFSDSQLINNYLKIVITTFGSYWKQGFI